MVLLVECLVQLVFTATVLCHFNYTNTFNIHYLYKCSNKALNIIEFQTLRYNIFFYCLCIVLHWSYMGITTLKK
ncbi:hypothetical protein C0J52_22807 [Blattella germanica]|nr:hypothetical protein C0J52_22807 [Blattella germanica]